ncbi:MAG: DNA photolyase family protein [Rhodocyclaceae bacterium]|nr:DNA photolyase family protein [Rhodocyclaceae bacterium]
MTSALVWFRRDLRAHDHAALYSALRDHQRVWCAFVFDSDILAPLLQKGLRDDRRLAFIHASLVQLDEVLRSRGGGLRVRHGRAVEEIPRLAAELGVDAVYANRDYEPAARDRDAEVASRLMAAGCGFVDCKDQVIFDRDEVLTQAGRPFSVFTPYRNAWLKKLDATALAPHPLEPHLARLASTPAGGMPTLAELGFTAADPAALPLSPGVDGAQRRLRDFVARIDDYAATRDYPALNGTSLLSVHLRFGTLSVRQLAAYAWGRATHMNSAGARVWLNELIWREFYQMILWHRPQVVERCFKPECEHIVWDDAPQLFAAWCAGSTGYPLVDAAMRQLNSSGTMHNRLRMVTASFLSKDLGIDWRRGEACFAERLLDYDLASNNGGWQWAASTGCDAQPWFRIFNPVTQSEKFDPKGDFIRRYVPELAAVPNRFIHAPWRMDAAQQAACGVVIGRDYPAPVVDHAVARERTLARFKRIAPILAAD